MAGTCPSTTWMPIFAVWHKPSAFGMPRFSRAFLCAIERANSMETIHRELTEKLHFCNVGFPHPTLALTVAKRKVDHPFLKAVTRETDRLVIWKSSPRQGATSKITS